MESHQQIKKLFNHQNYLQFYLNLIQLLNIICSRILVIIIKYRLDMVIKSRL